MKKNVRSYTGIVLAVTVIAAQLTGNWTAGAEDTQEYTGTTQISTSEVYPAIDTSTVELEVEEVYAEAGSQLSEGDQILKLTQESYQKALDYYEAALIKAESTLTDTQLEYDQGVLEANYTRESTKADAENAEYIRTYQTNEVEQALTDHEETLSDINDRIAELESGIADGSYDASSGGASVGGVSGGNTGSASGQKKSEGTQEKETETELETKESEQTEQSEPETTGSENTGSTEMDQSEIEPGGTQPGTDGANQDTIESSTSQKTTEELRQELTAKMSEAEELAQKLMEELKSAMESKDTDEVDSSIYTTYTEQLKNIISQLEADIDSQKNVKNVLDAYDFSEEDDNQSTLSASINGDEAVLSSLKEIQEKMSKYQTLISSMMNLWSADGSTVMVDSSLLTEMNEYLSKQSEIHTLTVTLLEQYETKEKYQETTESERETQQETEESERVGEDSQNPNASNGDKTQNGYGAGNMPGGTTGSGNMTGAMQGGGNASGDGTGVAQSASGNENAVQTNGLAEQGGQSALSDEEISLLGDSYDLSSVKQLIAREPSDSEAAQDLIEELQDNKENTEVQYEELKRKEKIFELEIQYTYDTAVIAGKLAELTCQQTLSEWEETLAEAKQEKADLETQKSLLEAIPDGVICADRDGTVAEISYEAGDVLSSSIPVVSYYDTDTVNITLEIPQEEIAELSVGDTAEVMLAGAGKMDGTLTEKSVEPEDGTSRTTVNYTATVSVDNSDGRLSDGLSATVIFAKNAETESEEEAAGNE